MNTYKQLLGWREVKAETGMNREVHVCGFKGNHILFQTVTGGTMYERVLNEGKNGLYFLESGVKNYLVEGV